MVLVTVVKLLNLCQKDTTFFEIEVETKSEVENYNNIILAFLTAVTKASTSSLVL